MKFTSLMPNLAVNDIRATVNFYQEVLGFNLVMTVPVSQDGIDNEFLVGREYVYALVERDGINVMFQRKDSFEEDIVYAKNGAVGASVSFYFTVEKLDDLFQSLSGKELEKTAIETTWYGQREFYLKDNNGYILGFAEQKQ